MARKSAKAKKSRVRKSTPTKAKLKAKARKPPAKTPAKRARRAVRGRSDNAELVAYEARGIGARSAGQAGDTQGISATPTADSESVEELLEEGQSFEAEILNGVERAADPDESEVVTREVEEDDVPEEYREHRENEN
jgi:hypothetical protein